MLRELLPMPCSVLSWRTIVVDQLVAAAAQQAEHCRLAGGVLSLEEWHKQEAALLVAGTAAAPHAAVRRAKFCTHSNASSRLAPQGKSFYSQLCCLSLVAATCAA